MKGKKPSPQRLNEIQKEKDALKKELETVFIEDFESESKSERDYTKEFKTLYNVVRKGLVLLHKKRGLKMINGEDALTQAKELLQKYS
jgi:hypothetical protein